MSRDATDPAHYKHGAVECWEFAGAMGFLLGSASKYLYRAGHKDDAAQDVGKAKKFIEREMFERTFDAGTYTQPSERAAEAFEKWYLAEDGSLRGEIVRALWASNQMDVVSLRHWGLMDAVRACDDLIEELEE